MTKNSEVNEILGNLGFSEKEVAVYLEILRRGRVTPAQIAKGTGINRSSVYVIVASLVQKGLIYEEVGNKTAHFIAKPVDELEGLYQRDRRALERKRKLVESAIEKLERYPRDTNYAPPRVRYIEEAELEEYLFEQMKEWNRSAVSVDSTCWGFQDRGFVKRFRKWVVWASKSYHLKICLLAETSETETSLRRVYGTWRKNRHPKEPIDFATSVWIMGEYVITLSIRERPHYLVEIRDAVLAHNMRELFRRLWEEAEDDNNE